MASVTIRNVPDEIHRAIKVRAARNGRSIEAEIRYILEIITKPNKRIKLGEILFDIGKELKLINDEINLLENMHDNVPARFASFE